MEALKERLEKIEWGKQQPNGEVLLSPAWEVFVLAISILSVFNLFVGCPLSQPDYRDGVLIMDSILTIFFVADLLRRLAVADDEHRAYLTRGCGWIDVLSTIPVPTHPPALPHRPHHPGHGSARRTWRAFVLFFSNKASGGLLSVLLIALLMLEFGAWTML